MSVNTENSGGALVRRGSNRADEPITGVSSNLIEEGTKANLELLNEQISTLIQLLNQLIQGNSACKSPTAVHRTQRAQTGSSPGSEFGISRTLPGTAIGSTDFCPKLALKR